MRRSVRDEIVASARRLLEDRGVEEALTLRAVARGAGIAAPSIYNHFPDLEAVLEAVIDDAFGDFDAATRGEAATIEDPLERLRFAAASYVRFARAQPATYRILFARPRPSPLPAVRARALAAHEVLVDTIAACVGHGRPADADARLDAAVFWATVHGIGDLRSSNPRFPWPDEAEMIDRLIDSVVLHATRASS